MNCIAVDDEPLALEIITEFCSKINYLNLISTFTNPNDAVSVLNNGNIDLIFLDIHMPQLNGLDFLKTLYKPPMVIFTTAYKEHAFQGFEFDAVDYLVKPFGFDRFTKSVNKAQQLSKQKLIADQMPEINAHNAYAFIMVKVEYSTKKINLDDILYIEGLKDYVKIYTGDRPILTKTTMKNIGEKLPSDRFFRVHKSFIISLDKIDLIENSRIVIGKQRIPIGESYKIPFVNLINRNMI